MSPRDALKETIRTEIDHLLPQIIAGEQAAKRLRKLDLRVLAGVELGYALTNLLVLSGLVGRIFDGTASRRIKATLESIDAIGDKVLPESK
jgi:hypothetical protein